MSLGLWILGSFLAWRALNEWRDYVERFSQEEFNQYNRSTSNAITMPGLARQDVLRDAKPAVLTWLAISLGFILVFALAQFKGWLDLAG